MTKNILHNIEKNMSSFSKGQKLIARFILENYDKAAFMTASKLGKTVQVSESTVVRFATQLGYEGYPSMQRALQEMIRGKLTSIQRIQASDGELAGSDLMTNVLQRDMEKIRMAIDQTDGAEFERVVDTIIGARRIYIVGFRSSSFLAGYLNFYFRLIFDNVTLVNGGAAGSFDQLFRVSKGDVVIGICFPRYSELALKTIQFARDRGATIVGVTDSEMSPINQMSSNSLLVRSEMISFVDSLAAPMSMLNALILAVANKKGADISATFSELEHIWERFDIFGKIEDESGDRCHRRRRGRHDGRDLRRAQGCARDAARSKRAPRQKGEHHRQGPLQRDEREQLRGAACPRAAESAIFVLRVFPL